MYILLQGPAPKINYNETEINVYISPSHLDSLEQEIYLAYPVPASFSVLPPS